MIQIFFFFLIRSPSDTNTAETYPNGHKKDTKSMQIFLNSQNISKINQRLQSNSPKKMKNKPDNSFKGVHVEVQLWERERELRRKFVKSESDDYIKKMF